MNDELEGGSLPLAPDSSVPPRPIGVPCPAGSSATPSAADVEPKKEIPMPDVPGQFYFTVGQLMEVLKDLPQELPVLINGQNSGYENFFHPYVGKMIHDPESYYKDGEFQIFQEKYNNGEETFAAVLLSRVVRDD